MISLSLSQISAAVNGRLIGDDAMVEQVSTDSRTLQQGDVFIALKGPNFDGHKFVQQAKDIGCLAVVVESEQNVNIAQIVVQSSHAALGMLGAYVKQCVNPKTVAITGSSGKTTVKEMIAAILKPLGKVMATKGNFNNDIGVPLTLLSIQADDEFAVVELGANHQGEIEYTTNLAKPDVAIINNIAAAHLEGFGSLQGVAKAKGEIFSGLAKHGTAIYNRDTIHTEQWQWRLKDKAVQTFSTMDKSDVYATDIQTDSQGCAQFKLHCSQGEQQVRLSIPGKHNVSNALAAASATLALGISLTDVILGLETVVPVKGRVNVHQLTPKLTIIDDTYNANVESTKAAIDLLASYPSESIFVLGDFGELGNETAQYHREIGEFAAQKNIGSVLTVGVHSQHTSQVPQANGHHFNEQQDLIDYLANTLNNMEKAVTVLVKGSRSARMELVVKAIQKQFQQESDSQEATC